MKKAWLYISHLLLVLIFLLGIFILGSVLPIRNHYHFLVVLSGSMEPKIHTGSLVYIQPVSHYKVGDVATYQLASTSGNTTVTHRIVKIQQARGGPLYTFKGDANQTADSLLVTQASIVGKEFFTIPDLGYLLNYIRQPLGLALIVVIPSTLIIYEELRKIHKEGKSIIQARRERQEVAKKKASEPPQPKPELPRRSRYLEEPKKPGAPPIGRL